MVTDLTLCSSAVSAQFYSHLIKYFYKVSSHWTTGIIAHSNTENCINIRQYRKTVVEVCSTWCTKNDAHRLFPVDMDGM